MTVWICLISVKVTTSQVGSVVGETVLMRLTEAQVEVWHLRVIQGKPRQIARGQGNFKQGRGKMFETEHRQLENYFHLVTIIIKQNYKNN